MKQTIIALALIIFMACNKPIPRKNEITKIDIATSGCFGSCPSIAISIDSSLNYKYYGGRYASLRGYYLGRVTNEFWDSLNIKLENINYKRMDTNYSVAADAPESELIIHYGGQIRHIQTMVFGHPDSIVNVLNWLNYSYKHVKLYRSTDKIKFETTAQNEPPKPLVDSVEFPPPVKRPKN